MKKLLSLLCVLAFAAVSAGGAAAQTAGKTYRVGFLVNVASPAAIAARDGLAQELGRRGFPADKLDGVAEAIRFHQAKDEPSTMEGILLRDADILEQLGAIGIMRALAKVGRDTRFPSFSSVLPVIYNATNQLPGRLRLISSKSLAERRVEILRSFLAAIEEEAGDLLY